MSFIFDYDKFFEYYTDPKNRHIDDRPRPIIYYFNRSDIHKPVKTTYLSKYYIIIDGVKIYISEVTKNNNPHKELLFTIPTEINGVIYDFHYHFGFRTINRKDPIKLNRLYFYNNNAIQPSKTMKTRTRKRVISKISQTREEVIGENILHEIIPDNNREFVIIDQNEKRVFFHKTIQLPDKDGMIGINEHNSCHFQNKIKIYSTSNIICLDDDNKYMKLIFSSEELHQITEIIKRPFLSNISFKLRGGKILSRKRR